MNITNTTDIIFNTNKRVDSTSVRMRTIIDYRKYTKNPEKFNVKYKTDQEYKKYIWEAFYSIHGNLVKSCFNVTKNKVKILDLGCGDAYGLENWITGIEEYDGVDLSLDQLKIARKYITKNLYPNTNFYLDEVDSNRIKNFYYDAVLSSEIFEHLDNPEHHVQTCNKKLKKGGYLILSTPCSSIYFHPSYWLTLITSREGIILFYKLLNVHKYWKEMLPHHPAISPIELENIITKNGFKIIKHFSSVWYLDNPWQLVFRVSRKIEDLGITVHLKYLLNLYKFLERLTGSNIPLLKFTGTRQFVLAQKI